MNNDGVTDDRGLAAQGKVRVGKELLGGAQVQDLASHVETAEFGGKVPDPAAEWCLVGLTILVNSETGHSFS